MTTDNCFIVLTQGKVAIVSPEDYEYVSQFNWYAAKCSRSDDLWYARHAIGKRFIFLHTTIAKRAGLPKSPRYDHKNRDGLDCRRENIRPCTPSQNCANRKKEKGCTSKFKGVSWHKATNKWRACICINYKCMHLGLFQTEQEAHEAYAVAAVRLFGEFARV